jgi:amino acid transporter
MNVPPPAPVPRRQLTALDTTSIIVGIIIGAGIFETTPVVAANVPGPMALLGIWLAGGLVALVGALCYAELTTTYPRSGGDYVFLTRAYGRGTGFLFAWAEYWIVRPGNVGAMAYVFARYAHQLWPLGTSGHDFVIYA